MKLNLFISPSFPSQQGSTFTSNQIFEKIFDDLPTVDVLKSSQGLLGQQVKYQKELAKKTQMNDLFHLFLSLVR